MAKGSVRKKGKKWYYRFYIEDESGNLVQREFVGTESKSETEALLRKAMEDYEEKKFVAKSENATVGMLLDMWVEEELKPGSLSNGTVMAYQGTVNRIKQHPIGSRKLKTVTADHLQAYMDFLSFGGTNPDGTTAKALSKGYLRLFSAVLQGAFRFAVFPKRLITFNPMQYVVWRGKKEDYDLFSDEDGNEFTMEVLDYFFYEGKEYALLAEVEDDCECDACDHDDDCDCGCEEREAYIMEVVPVGDDEEEFVPVDEELAERLIEMVENQLYDDEDEDDEEE